MNRIGIHNNDEGQRYLTQHFDDLLQDSSNILGTFQKRLENGSLIDVEIRESLLAGPGGFLKVESAWQILPGGSRKLITIIPYGD
jgi:filamentous hemagglutinin